MKGLVSAALVRAGIDPSAIKPNDTELHAISGRRFENDVFKGEHMSKKKKGGKKGGKGC